MNFEIHCYIFLFFLVSFLFNLIAKLLKKIKYLFYTLTFYLTKMFLLNHVKLIFMKIIKYFIYFNEKVTYFIINLLITIYSIIVEFINFFLVIIKITYFKFDLLPFKN